MSNFQIQVSTKDQYTIAMIVGYADSTNVTEVNEKIVQIIEGLPSGHSLILDGQLLQYINSTFIGYMTDWYSRLERSGGRLLLAQLMPNTLDTLTVVGLTNLMPHYKTLQEAELAASGTSTSSANTHKSVQPAAQNLLEV